ncbi:MAG: hypothetical protein KGN36_16185 [Acidobacteriota bacterium]|nr:hypothetical protein [Acidobacteriota bacterium]
MRRLMTLCAFAALLSLGMLDVRAQDTGSDKTQKRNAKATQKGPEKEKKAAPKKKAVPK